MILISYTSKYTFVHRVLYHAENLILKIETVRITEDKFRLLFDWSKIGKKKTGSVGNLTIRGPPEA